MKILIDLFFLTIIVCYVIDCSGFVQSIKRQFLRKIMHLSNPNPSVLNWKPFDCSQCLTFYVCLIYIIVTNHFMLMYVFAAVIFSLLSSNISGLLLCIKDYLAAFEMWLQKQIEE